MKNKKRYIVPFAIILILSYASVKIPFIHAQQPLIANDIPSDLSLDLNLAQQNPAPDRQTIVASETKQAEIVTTTGQTTTVQPQDTVAPAAETESTKDALNPNQTTSEQVVTTPVTVEVDQNETPFPTAPTSSGEPEITGESPEPSTIAPSQEVSPTGTSDLVPGTTVVSPDDNAAPADNSTNPNLPAPTSAVDNTSINQPTGTDQGPSSNVQQSPQQSQTTGSSATQGSDNSGQGQPTSAPATDTNGTQQQPSQPSDNSTNTSNTGGSQAQPQTAPPSNDTNGTQQQPSQPSDNSTNPNPPSDTNTSGDSGTVQGAATGSNLTIIQNLTRVIQKVWHAITGN